MLHPSVFPPCGSRHEARFSSSRCFCYYEKDEADSELKGKRRSAGRGTSGPGELGNDEDFASIPLKFWWQVVTHGSQHRMGVRDSACQPSLLIDSIYKKHPPAMNLCTCFLETHEIHKIIDRSDGTRKQEKLCGQWHERAGSGRSPSL